MPGLRGNAGLKAAATWEAVVVVAVDGGADGVAPGVGAESLTVFVLGDVDGLQESLGHVGDGAGDSGFYIAADDGGDEAAQSGAEIAGGEIFAGKVAGKVRAETLRGAGASFFFGVVVAEMGMVAEARSAATAAIGERKHTQGHAVLGTESGHKSLLRVEFWDCLLKRTDTSRQSEIGVPVLQNRNAPAGAGAWFSTGGLYHNGNAGQVKKLGPRKETSKSPPSNTEDGAPARAKLKN
jgi:hypothetical protein